jgi:hypothetical protein
LQGQIKSFVKPDSLPINDVLLEPFLNRKIGQGGARGACILGGDPLKQGGEDGEGVLTFDLGAMILVTPRRPVTVKKEITASARNTKNRIWAMPAACSAMPLKPRTAATIAMTRKVMA